MGADSHGLAGMRVVDERGKVEEGEGEGVTRDIIATFWQQFFSSAAIGDKEKVPAIRHDYQKSEWEAIGVWLQKSGILPSRPFKGFRGIVHFWRGMCRHEVPALVISSLFNCR